MAEVPGGLELLKDGTVRMHVTDGRFIKLRRPKVGEFRKLREQLQTRRDEIALAIDEAREDEPEAEESEDTAAVGDDAEVARQRVEAANLRAQKMNERIEEANADWMAEAVGVLGDRPLPARDEWEFWMLNADTISELVKHWQTVPLVRSAP